MQLRLFIMNKASFLGLLYHPLLLVIITVVFLSLPKSGCSQSIALREILSNPHLNFYEAQDQAKTFLLTADTTLEGDDYMMFQRWEWFWKDRVTNDDGVR